MSIFTWRGFELSLNVAKTLKLFVCHSTAPFYLPLSVAGRHLRCPYNILSIMIGWILISVSNTI